MSWPQGALLLTHQALGQCEASLRFAMIAVATARMAGGAGLRCRRWGRPPPPFTGRRESESLVGVQGLSEPEVEAGAVVGAMSVAGRPVRSGLQLVGLGPGGTCGLQPCFL